MIEYDVQSHTQIIIKEVIFQNFLKKELKIHLYHSHITLIRCMGNILVKKSYFSLRPFLLLEHFQLQMGNVEKKYNQGTKRC